MTSDPIPLAGVLHTADRPSTATGIFDYWLSVTRLPGRFVPMSVEPDDLGTVIGTLAKIGFVGVNVARPFQRLVIDIADIVTDRAALMSAANTLIFRRDGKVHADNTDGYGFIENIRQHAPNWVPTAGPALILGAGQVAREAATAMLDVGVDEIRIANRSRARAERLRTEFGGRIVVCDWGQAGKALEGAATVVNATPLGGPGKPELHVPLDALEPGTVVSDLVISPKLTRLLDAAIRMGCFPVDGIGMALYQAAPAFERWYGARPPLDDYARGAVLQAHTL